MTFYTKRRPHQMLGGRMLIAVGWKRGGFCPG
jgi:hypothetical protein